MKEGRTMGSEGWLGEWFDAALQSIANDGRGDHGN